MQGSGCGSAVGDERRSSALWLLVHRRCRYRRASAQALAREFLLFVLGLQRLPGSFAVPLSIRPDNEEGRRPIDMAVEDVMMSWVKSISLVPRLMSGKGGARRERFCTNNGQREDLWLGIGDVERRLRANACL